MATITLEALRPQTGVTDPQSVAMDHCKALKMSPQSRETFRSFSVGNDVEVDALVSAIIEGALVDVTRFGQSTQRRRAVQGLHRLYVAVREVKAREARILADLDVEPLPPTIECGDVNGGCSRAVGKRCRCSCGGSNHGKLIKN